MIEEIKAYGQRMKIQIRSKSCQQTPDIYHCIWYDEEDRCRYGKYNSQYWNSEKMKNLERKARDSGPKQGTILQFYGANFLDETWCFTLISCSASNQANFEAQNSKVKSAPSITLTELLEIHHIRNSAPLTVSESRLSIHCQLDLSLHFPIPKFLKL